MEESSAQLIELARSGDRRALELLLERHQAQIYRFGIKMCRDPEDAKDVLQDTLIAMARGVRTFRGTSSLSTWLYSIARSFCIKRRKKTNQEVPSSEALAESPSSTTAMGIGRPPAVTPEDALAKSEIERALRSAIASLEPAAREVLVLRDMEGLSAVEVATVLNISVQAVKSRLHRARLSVRKDVAPFLGVSGGGGPGCPDVASLFSQYLEDEIAADVCERMQRHVEVCDHCRSHCDALKQTLQLCRTEAQAVDVPADVQRSVRAALQDFLREVS